MVWQRRPQHGGLYARVLPKHYRAGRQGDPGTTQFFLSLEDDLMRIFGSDNISKFMDKLGMDEDEPITAKMITRSIEKAQKKVESHNFEIRKYVLEYDDVMNQQREVLYGQRRQVLTADSLRDTIMGMVDDIIHDGLDKYADEKLYPHRRIRPPASLCSTYLLLCCIQT